MKTLFIEAKRKDVNKDIDIAELKKLPKKLHLLYVIQYKDLAEKLEKQLKSKGYTITACEQVLGCSQISPKSDILLVGTGRFHAINLALQTEKKLYIYNGEKISALDEKEIEKLKLLQKAKTSKFLMSDNIALLVSSKPGQNKLKEAIKAKTKLAKKYSDKNFHIFISDNINLGDFENFPIDLFLNFACPGLEADSSKILNYFTLMQIYPL